MFLIPLQKLILQKMTLEFDKSGVQFVINPNDEFGLNKSNVV